MSNKLTYEDTVFAAKPLTCTYLDTYLGREMSADGLADDDMR